MTPDRLDKRDLILQRGAQVIVHRGYHATGVQEIVQAAGIPKGSFYHYFASKEEFALQALAYLYGPRLERYAQALSDASRSPRARLLGYYGDLRARFASRSPRACHCFIGSLGFEMADRSPAIALRVEAILQRATQILQVCLEEARQAGELPADEDCESLAHFITDAWQGALTRLKVGETVAPVERFLGRLERLLHP